jgi:hypothetical protein
MKAGMKKIGRNLGFGESHPHLYPSPVLRGRGILYFD